MISVYIAFGLVLPLVAIFTSMGLVWVLLNEGPTQTPADMKQQLIKCVPIAKYFALAGVALLVVAIGASIPLLLAFAMAAFAPAGFIVGGYIACYLSTRFMRPND